MKYLIFLITLLISCSKSQDIKVNRVIDKITSSNIKLFTNIAVDTRGKEKCSDKYLIARISYFHIDNNVLVLPPIDKIEWIVDTSQIYNYNIRKFGEINGIEECHSLQFYLEYFNDVTVLFNEIKVIELYNNPNLGDFTLFRIDENTDLIYLEDSSTIISEYWKIFFKANQTFDGKWYLKKE